MKHFMYMVWVAGLGAALFCIYVSPAQAVGIKYPGPYSATVDRVIDGDTIVATINIFPSLFARLSIRIHGVDTPESSKRWAKCNKEQLAGIKAKKFVKALFESKDVRQVKLTNIKFGKYAGRVLANVSFKIKGDIYDLKQLLIDRGFARPYLGKKKSDWCVTN